MNILYIYVSPSGKEYVGVTKRFRRRMYEHKRSDTPFGRALRKYGEGNFSVRTFEFEDIEEAYRLEAWLVKEEQVKSSNSYNQCVGGIGGNTHELTNPLSTSAENRKRQSEFMKRNNPMRCPEARANRKKAMATKEYREFHRNLTKQRMREPLQKAKALLGIQKSNEARAKEVSCEGTIFKSVAEAAHYYGIQRATLRLRIKSDKDKWKDFFYISTD